MSTNDCCLLYNKKENSFIEEDSTNLYSNLSLNQSHRFNPNEFSLHSKNIPFEKRKGLNCASIKGLDYLNDNVNHNLQKRKTTLNCSSLPPTLFNYGCDSDNEEKMKDHKFSSSMNSSTLSLHIAAYENSFTSDTFDCRNKSLEVNSDLIKKRENAKRIFLGSKSNIQNQFEFSRQQGNDEVTEPEVSQFQASQTLLNPNESISSNNFQRVKIFPNVQVTESLNQNENAPSNLPSDNPEHSVQAISPSIKSESAVKQNVNVPMKKLPNSLLSHTPPSTIPQSSTSAATVHVYVNNVASLTLHALISKSSESPSNNIPNFFTTPIHSDPMEENKSKSEYTCSICNFSLPSKFHYISHMNTHGDRQCLMCDYTTRTEGRLYKHMYENHTKEERINVGLNDILSETAALDHKKPPSAASNESILSLLPSSSSASIRSSLQKSSERKKKQYCCKHCQHISASKDESWEHSRAHIPLNKQLSCMNCAFVTGSKQHLNYHVQSHFGSKPFKCSKCSYSCANKSMLNSHMKSHSSEYQYSCADCPYQSKYLHGVNLHLQKYGHRRMQLNGGTVEAASIPNDQL